MTNHKILLKDCDIFNEVDLKKNKDIDFNTLAYRSAKKIWWKFNIYPAHSCGFFIKRKIHKKLGLYNTKFKYSADRDFIFKGGGQSHL